MKRRTLNSILCIVLTGMLLSGCSAVFTTVIRGAVFDREPYEEEPRSGPVEHVRVYLYDDKSLRDEDYDLWYASGALSGPLPEQVGIPDYISLEYSDADGEYTFSGFTWKESHPSFGSTADRQEVYLLYYHRDYGLQKNSEPLVISVTSDTENSLPDMLLDRMLNDGYISGSIEDQNERPIADVTVMLFIAKEWEYEGEQIVEESISWPREPDLQRVSDAEGEYSFSFSFPKNPSGSDDRGTVPVRITFDHTQYQARTRADSKIVEDGWDPDEDGQEDPYYPLVIEDGHPYSAREVTLASRRGSSELSFEVTDRATHGGYAQAPIRLYVATYWEYVDDQIDPSSIQWPLSPDVEGSSDQQGEFVARIEFDHMSDEFGSAPVRYVIVPEDGYVIPDYESEDESWAPRPFTEDSSQFNQLIVQDESTNTVEVSVKKTLFDQQELTGYLFSDTYPLGSSIDNDQRDRTDEYDEGRSGLLVGLYLTDSEPEEDSLEEAYQAMTSRRGSDGNGYFEFSNIGWSDELYSGDRSIIDAFLMIDTDRDELWDQAVPISLIGDMSGGNYEEIEVL